MKLVLTLTRTGIALDWGRNPEQEPEPGRETTIGSLVEHAGDDEPPWARRIGFQPQEEARCDRRPK